MLLGEYDNNPLLLIFIVLLLSLLILNYILGWSRPDKKRRKIYMADGNDTTKQGGTSPHSRGKGSTIKNRTNKCESEDGCGLAEDDCEYTLDEDITMAGLFLNGSPRIDGPSGLSHYHNKGPVSESQNLIDRYLAKINFNMTSEDLDQPWFHKCATREVAEDLLKGGDQGSFLVRPSSRRGSYAMSWVKDVLTGEVGHSLIYGLFPGFSLKQIPDLKERY